MHKRVWYSSGAVLGTKISSADAVPYVVLIAEQSRSLRRIYKGYLDALVSKPTSIHLACTGREALDAAQIHQPNLIILDLELSDIPGHDLVTALRQKLPETTILAVAVQSSLDTAVDAVRAGATDVLIKPLNREKIRHAIGHMTIVRSSTAAAEISEKISDSGAANGFIGTSPAMQIIYKTIAVAAPSNATVFITGESGTGKELYAQAIHRRSKRAGKALISLNCSAIPRDLIESEIFGHVRGAFTGATEDRDGAAILADGGTLFLDEICEMDLDLQTKLLRFIQTSTVQKVGDARAREVDVRFVCATNRNLLEEVSSGRFREDLYYRLHVIPVHMPPLRDREGDVRLLASAFLQRFALREGKTYSGFDAGALSVLETYGWPGNVRQLENLVQNVVVMNTGGEVTEAMLQALLSQPAHPCRPVGPQCPVHQFNPVVIRMPGRWGTGETLTPDLAQPSCPQAQVQPLWLEEKNIIERAVKVCGGNTVLAAALLEVSPSTLYRKRKSWARCQTTPTAAGLMAAKQVSAGSSVNRGVETETSAV
ncbi:Regulatory protein LuxO [hydrothermal vent metagenome]|uniref:Regulatory protein LuxO n=1 Tax=hydrothermal vent metagenome TaxID=652676 RepID=A0A3B0SGN4_9ZZZZ